MRFDLLCMMAGLLGLAILASCYLFLEETLKEKKGRDPALKPAGVCPDALGV